MTSIEVAALRIATAIAQIAGKAIIASRRSRVERGMTLVELAGARGIGLIPQRRLNRQVEQLAEAIAEKLDPVVESSAARMPVNERNAALLGVAMTFESADLSDDTVFDTNLDEGKLLAVLQQQSKGLLASLGLSEQAEALYHLVLRESVAHLTEVIVTLPSFQQRATKELLSRDNEIIDLLREVLDRMPQRDLLRGSSPDAQFRLDYCREVRVRRSAGNSTRPSILVHAQRVVGRGGRENSSQD